MEIAQQTWDSKKSNDAHLSKMQGLDDRPISATGAQHFSAHRFLCRSCNTAFCRNCKQFPYHVGFDCNEFEEWKVAPKCRFCGQVCCS